MSKPDTESSLLQPKTPAPLPPGSSPSSLGCQAHLGRYQCCSDTWFKLPERAAPHDMSCVPPEAPERHEQKGQHSQAEAHHPNQENWKGECRLLWTPGGRGLRQESLGLWGHRVARRCRGREIRTSGQITTSCLVPRPDNNHLLSPKARYGKLLPKEKLPELGHVRKGSGPSNRWSLPRQQVFQSTHESGVTDRPTKELQVQDPKAFAGCCGLSVRANTADIL